MMISFINGNLIALVRQGVLHDDFSKIRFKERHSASECQNCWQISERTMQRDTQRNKNHLILLQSEKIIEIALLQRGECKSSGAKSNFRILAFETPCLALGDLVPNLFWAIVLGITLLKDELTMESNMRSLHETFPS